MIQNSARRELFLEGTNITRFVDSVPNVPKLAADFGQLIVNDLPNLTGINTFGFWDVLAEASPFFGEADTDLFTLEIRQGGEVLWIGRVEGIDVTQDYATANVVIKSEIGRALDTACVYGSATPRTPAEIVADIADLFKIPYDPLSFSRANQFYTQNKIYCSSDVTTAELPIIQVFQAAAAIGCARIYVRDNKLAMDVFSGIPTFPPVLTLSTDPAVPINRVITPPDPSPLQKQRLNGITVNYFGGAVPIGLPDSSSPSIAASPSDPLTILDLQSAVFIGNLWLQFLNSRQQNITLGVTARLGNECEIGTPLALDYFRGGWNVTFDVVGVQPIDILETTITGLTRPISD